MFDADLLVKMHPGVIRRICSRKVYQESIVRKCQLYALETVKGFCAGAGIFLVFFAKKEEELFGFSLAERVRTAAADSCGN